MPDTLPAPWTWQNVPFVERAVLSGVSSTFNCVRFGTRLMSPAEMKFTYGIEIWQRLPFMLLHSGSTQSVYVFCTEKQIVVRSYVSELMFELAKPNSIEEAITSIRSILGVPIE